MMPKTTYSLETATQEGPAIFKESINRVNDNLFYNEPPFKKMPAVKIFANRCKQMLHENAADSKVYF